MMNNSEQAKGLSRVYRTLSVERFRALKKGDELTFLSAAGPNKILATVVVHRSPGKSATGISIEIIKIIEPATKGSYKDAQPGDVITPAGINELFV
jgi:hypothetical protein